LNQGVGQQTEDQSNDRRQPDGRRFEEKENDPVEIDRHRHRRLRRVRDRLLVEEVCHGGCHGDAVVDHSEEEEEEEGGGDTAGEEPVPEVRLDQNPNIDHNLQK